MDRAKEILEEIGGIRGVYDRETTLEAMEQYVQQENKEVAKKAFKAGENKGRNGDKHYLLIPDFNSYWESKQEDK